jgi:hypothetical protein
VDVVILKDCFIKPSGLYRYPSGPSSPSPASSPKPSGALSLRWPWLLPWPFAYEVPPLFPSISRYVRKLPETRLALQLLPSVHRRMPASRSSHTKTEPDLIDCRSFSDSLRCTRGKMPNLHASNRIIASVGVRTSPL